MVIGLDFFFSNYENIYAIYILSKDLRKDM